MTPAALDILNSIDRLPIDDKNELMVEVLRRFESQWHQEIDRLYQGRFEELRSLIQVGIDDVNAGRTVDGKTAIAQLKQKNRDRLSHG
jgi:predicted RecB family endonuclease